MLSGSRRFSSPDLARNVICWNRLLRGAFSTAGMDYRFGSDLCERLPVTWGGAPWHTPGRSTVRP